MNTLENLRDMFCKELNEIARKPEMSAGDLDTAHKLTDTIKNIDKICIMDESCEYSQAGDWEMTGRGNSYARGRDSRDRYTSEKMYSRESSKERMIEKLEDMLKETYNDKERTAILRCIDQLERA